MEKNRIFAFLVFVCLLSCGPFKVGAAVNKPLWKKSLGTEIAGAPVFLQSRLIVLTRQGYLVAADLQGNRKWQHRLSGACFASPRVGPKGLIYVAELNGKIEILSLEGKKISELSGTAPFRAAPLVDSGLIVLADEAGNLSAYSRESRKPLWNTNLGNPVFAAPVFSASGEILVAAKDHCLFCVSRQGRILWTCKTRGVNYASPALDGNGDILLTTMGRSLYRISSGGNEIWRFDTPRWIASSPVIDRQGNTFFGCYDTFFYCVNRLGKLKWKTRCSGAVNASPVIDKSGVVYTGDSSGRFLALDSQNGHILWQYKTADFVRSPLMLHAEKKLLAGGGLDSFIYVFSAADVLDRQADWPCYLGKPLQFSCQVIRD